jgi:hypothetical protein
MTPLHVTSHSPFILLNLPIIGGAHLQYVHKHCAKFKYYWLSMVRVLDYTNKVQSMSYSDKKLLSSKHGKCTEKFVKSAHNRRCTSSICIQTLCKVWIILIEHCWSFRLHHLGTVHYSQYLLSVICNSNSFQSILFKLCTVFVYILQMCTSYYGLIWRFVSYMFCMLNLVFFYHYM